MTARRVLVVGGGPGGLVTALALRRAGIGSTVVEQVPVLRALGAGVSLWPNAVKLLRRWGVGAAVEAGGAVASGGAISTWRGRRLVALDAGSLEARFGAPLVVIHCASLQRILRAALDRDTLQLGSRCVAVEQDAHSASAVLGEGQRRQADVVIGADGDRSVVRAAVVGDGPSRYSGLTAWRGVVPLDRALAEALLTGEWWGSGAVFGIARLGGNQAYWWATARGPRTSGGSPDEEKTDLLRRFARWCPPIPELIDASVPEAISRTPLRYRPTSGRRSLGRIAVLGDAADITAPGLSQGACQAIEDAAAVTESLLGTGGDAAALTRYSDLRRRHVATVNSKAGRLSRVAHAHNPMAVRLRDTVLRAAPAGAPLGWLAPVIGHEISRAR